MKQVHFITGILFVAVLAIAAAPAHAVCTNCSQVSNAGSTTRQEENDHFQDTADWIDEEFDDWRNWLDDTIADYVMPVFPRLAHQFSVIGLQQIAAIGGFFDATKQLDTQRVVQEMSAEAHKDYQPSLQMCVFGTNMRGLAQAQTAAETSAAIMNRWSQGRASGQINAAATEGEHTDRASRLELFRRRYCDSRDNGGGMIGICGTAPIPTASYRNKDISYARTIERWPTLESDLQSSGSIMPFEEEQDIFSLASNLYGHRALFRIPEKLLSRSVSSQKILDIRSLIAKRSVAEASFFTIAGERTESTASPANGALHMMLIMKSLGLTDDQARDLIGRKPSYNAQMEVLTKKIYQDPVFYTNLYDKPANIERTKVSLQAIGLMQDFDTLQSYLRTEMMLSLILELSVMKMQGEVENKLGQLKAFGENG